METVIITLVVIIVFLFALNKSWDGKWKEKANKLWKVLWLILIINDFSFFGMDSGIALIIISFFAFLISMPISNGISKKLLG